VVELEVAVVERWWSWKSRWWHGGGVRFYNLYGGGMAVELNFYGGGGGGGKSQLHADL
jgi:hypothetical protein